NSFSRALDEFHRPVAGALELACHGQEPRRGFEADHARDVARIERQGESGTDADFEHAALGCPGDTGALGSEIFLPHRPVDQQRNDLILIEPHFVTRTNTRLRALSRQCKLHKSHSAYRTISISAMQLALS